jgi:hypothetical protein
MLRPVRRVSVAVVLVAATFLGCSGDDDDAVEATSTSSSTTSSTTVDEAPVTTAGIEGEGLAEIESVAQGLLLSPSGLNDPSFVDAGYAPDVVVPCEPAGTTPPVTPLTLAGTVLRSEARNTTVIEELRVYATPESAVMAFEEAASMTPCATGIDSSDRMGTTARTAALIDGNGAVTLAVVADVVVIVFVEHAPAGPDGDATPEAVAATAIGTVLAYLEG